MASDEGAGPDPAEAAAAELDALEARLRAVDVTLARLGDGSYATCGSCGRPLDPGSLEADPLTSSCPTPCRP